MTKNNSHINDAKNLKIIWPLGFPNIKFDFGKDDYLKATDSIRKEIIFEKLIPEEAVQKATSVDRFDYFCPHELKYLSFILCYENEYGKKFYIRFVRKDKNEIFDKKPHLLKPKDLLELNRLTIKKMTMVS